MHRTQIYFDESFYEEIKQAAARMNISVSAYIRTVLKKNIELEKNGDVDFSDFAGMWQDSDVTLEEIRKKAWG